MSLISALETKEPATSPRVPPSQGWAPDLAPPPWICSPPPWIRACWRCFDWYCEGFPWLAPTQPHSTTVAVMRLGSFSEVGSLDLIWWPGPKIFRKVGEQLSEQLCKKNGGAARRRFFSYYEKASGGGVQTPPSWARVKLRPSRCFPCQVWCRYPANTRKWGPLGPQMGFMAKHAGPMLTLCKIIESST